MSRKRVLQLAVGGGLTAAGLLVSASGPISAAAVTSTGSTNAHVAVNSVITLSGLTSNFTLTGNPNATAAQNAAVTMNVQTNNVTGYTVTVQSATANLVGTGANADVIPVTALSARETGAPTFSALSNTAALTVHSQATRSISTGDVLSNDFSVAIPFVNSDTYSTTLNYVAATQ